MHDFLVTSPMPMMDVCPKCHSRYTYRKDGSNNLVRQLCQTCHPPESTPTAEANPLPWLPPIIAFTGLAQSGKTTCANYLKEKFGFGIFSFAAPLKRMLATLVDCRDKDSTPYVLCGKTVRHAMQTLGTEWGRELIGPDIWIRAARMEIERVKLTGAHGITCDDVRFDNEAQLVRELGGIVISLERPGQSRMNHVSEKGVNSALITANLSAGDMDELLGGLDSCLAGLPQ